jgi:hypothetical protein
MIRHEDTKGAKKKQKLRVFVMSEMADQRLMPSSLIQSSCCAGALNVMYCR